jgi:hypothetical protein
MVQELKKVGTIDLTPTWQEILPTWKVIVDDATKALKPDQLQRFWTEMQRMAESADRYSFLLEYLRVREGITDDNIEFRLDIGKQELLKRRMTIKPVGGE